MSSQVFTIALRLKLTHTSCLPAKYTVSQLYEFRFRIDSPNSLVKSILILGDSYYASNLLLILFGLTDLRFHHLRKMHF